MGWLGLSERRVSSAGMIIYTSSGLHAVSSCRVVKYQCCVPIVAVDVVDVLPSP